MSNPTFPKLIRNEFSTLQVNLGYRCNQTCQHCHVNAGPNRKEMMDIETIKLVLKVLKKFNVTTLDLTGGAPELNPWFRELVSEATKMGVEVIDRCNLTILNEPGQESLGEFLAENKVIITASLPCYQEENVDKQRGKGVFERSIMGLKDLNKLGYGKEHSNLILNLVFNPQGPHLPPAQAILENNYRDELFKSYGIHFTSLFTITNMPINRFATQLKIDGTLNQYQRLLEDSYNPENLKSVMCKYLISVNWTGELYDCDFNQQLNLKSKGKAKTLSDLIELNKLEQTEITVGPHCFGCTAGSGSSCGGALNDSS